MEDTTRKAVRLAAKSIKQIRSVYISEQSVVVEGDNVTEFMVNVKFTFEVK